jgi:SMC interacting uncharacterized protein involved in chromosome segregation
MTIEEQLIKAASDLSALTAERDELRASIEAAAVKESKDFEATLAKNAELNTQLELLGTEKAGLLVKIAELEKNQVTASVEAAKIAASVGVAPVELSPSDITAEATAPVNHLQHFLSLPMGAERSSYFAKYKNEIIRGI